jgi:hypothetical protein
MSVDSFPVSLYACQTLIQLLPRLRSLKSTLPRRALSAYRLPLSAPFLVSLNSLHSAQPSFPTLFFPTYPTLFLELHIVPCYTVIKLFVVRTMFTSGGLGPG